MLDTASILPTHRAFEQDLFNRVVRALDFKYNEFYIWTLEGKAVYMFDEFCNNLPV